MTKDEAMKLALEALKDMNCGWGYIRESHGDLYGVGWDRAQEKADDAIKALRQALEQPEQEPVAFYVYEWRNPDGSSVFRSFRADEHQFGRAPDSVIPVPAQLPKQEFVCSTGLCHYKHWVGLTEDEVSAAVDVCEQNVKGEFLVDYARAIETKLKEKNT